MKRKVVVVMPAYNAERTIEATFKDIQEGSVDEVIVVDDHSSDRTVEVAKALGLTVIQHDHNCGYGRNQKTRLQEVTVSRLLLLMLAAFIRQDMIG